MQTQKVSHSYNANTHTESTFPYRVEQLEFPGENDTVRELGVTVILFHVLEPLEVERKDLWETLHSQSLCGLLFAAALLTVVLVLCCQGLRG